VKWYVAICLLLLCGCSYTCTKHPVHVGSSGSVPVYLSDDLPEYLRDAAIDAVHQWNLVLNGHLLLDVRSEHVSRKQVQDTDVIFIDVAKDKEPMILEIHDPDIAGLTAPWGHRRPSALILLVEHKTRGIATELILHELGHALGAHHQEGTLMQARHNDQVVCVDKATWAQVAKVWHWDIESGNWCQ
jgi:hypothetical protein